MKDYTEERLDKIDALNTRIDALFRKKDGGYGDDMRHALRLAGEHNRAWTLSYCDAILSIVDELLVRMEIDDREQKAEDAYWSAVHDAQVGA